jgi:hypothetical protein
MNPTVQVALIAGGTTATVGIAGFWSTVHATGRQIRSGQDAKLWDAGAAVYIDVRLTGPPPLWNRPGRAHDLSGWVRRTGHVPRH